MVVYPSVELNESPELDIIVACNLVDFSSFWLWGYPNLLM